MLILLPIHWDSYRKRKKVLGLLSNKTEDKEVEKHINHEVCKECREDITVACEFKKAPWEILLGRKDTLGK